MPQGAKPFDFKCPKRSSLPPEETLHLCRFNKKKILQESGLNIRQGWLEKINRNQASLRTLSCLYAVTNTYHPQVGKILNHTKRISRGLLHLLLSPVIAELLSPDLLYEIGQENAYSVKYKKSLISSVKRGQDLGLLPSVITSMSKMTEFIATMRAVPDAVVSNDPYPAIPDFNSIEELKLEAIRTPLELIVEGVHQRNCVWDYNREIARGTRIIFQDEFKGERATFGLSQKNHKWKAEAKAKGNRKVSDSMFKALKKWSELNQVNW